MKKQTGVELILASQNEMTGDIVYTFKQTFPRIILAEVNTHTIASKNTASSRAIPTLTQLKSVLKDPFLPVSIGRYQKGMQAGAEITGWRRKANELLWLWLRYPAVAVAWLTYILRAPKQFSNRLIEPWTWTEQIWTSTDIQNELMLRNHPTTEPHYEILAKEKQQLINKIKHHFNVAPVPSLIRKTQTLKLGEWHLPYVNWWEFKEQLHDHLWKSINLVWQEDKRLFALNPASNSLTLVGTFNTEMDIAKAVSAARCAWVSYNMPGEGSAKMSNIPAALQTYNKLAGDTIKHLSPLMHVVTPLPLSVRVGSHCGFLMFRKELEGESGGDKVVPSITPWMAKQLLADASVKGTPYHEIELIDRLGDLFQSELLKTRITQFKTEQLKETEVA
jgi:hypothetical protein